jgi:hypothetical protein
VHASCKLCGRHEDYKAACWIVHARAWPAGVAANRVALRCGCHRRRDDLLLASSASHLSDARGWGPKEPAASARRSAGRPPGPRQHRLTVVEWSPAAGSIAACPRGGGGGGGGGVGGGGEDGGGDRMARARRQRRRRRSLSWPAASSSSASSPPGRFRCRGGSTRRRGTARGGGQRERWRRREVVSWPACSHRAYVQKVVSGGRQARIYGELEMDNIVGRPTARRPS